MDYIKPGTSFTLKEKIDLEDKKTDNATDLFKQFRIHDEETIILNIEKTKSWENMRKIDIDAVRMTKESIKVCI
jgi:hypothetical protein